MYLVLLTVRTLLICLLLIGRQIFSKSNGSNVRYDGILTSRLVFSVADSGGGVSEEKTV